MWRALSDRTWRTAQDHYARAKAPQHCGGMAVRESDSKATAFGIMLTYHRPLLCHDQRILFSSYKRAVGKKC